MPGTVEKRQAAVNGSEVDLSIIDATPEQRALCGDDMQCLFDYVTSGDEFIAESTMTSNQELDVLIELLGKYVHSFSEHN